MTAVVEYRRPREKWCTDTAVRLLQIGCRDERLSVEERTQFVAVAARLDLLGREPVRS